MKMFFYSVMRWLLAEPGGVLISDTSEGQTYQWTFADSTFEAFIPSNHEYNILLEWSIYNCYGALNKRDPRIFYIGDQP